MLLKRFSKIEYIEILCKGTVHDIHQLVRKRDIMYRHKGLVDGGILNKLMEPDTHVAKSCVEN